MYVHVRVKMYVHHLTYSEIGRKSRWSLLKLLAQHYTPLFRGTPTSTHFHSLLYSLLAYAYCVRYDDWIRSGEWTFLFCALLGAGHALSFLVTRWSTAVKDWITARKVSAF